MSSLTITQKTHLDDAFGMGSGYVLDFTDGSFQQFFADLGIDIYDTDKYAGFGTSKAKRLRALWKSGTDAEVSTALAALAEYVEAKQSIGALDDVTADQLAMIRETAEHLGGAAPSALAPAPVAITSEATVTRNRISLEIHEDIYSHIAQYLETGDHFHAVEESYKVVREKLRELTGNEKATDVFNQASTEKKHYAALFGTATPANDAQADFFRGVGYLHLGVQFLRNEKAHTPATEVEPNLALHYISLASLAYDLITKFVSEATIDEIEAWALAQWQTYRSATAFYAAFVEGKWLHTVELPGALTNASVRAALKEKWLSEANFARSWNESNRQLMRLQLVVDQVTAADLDHMLDLPTKDRYDNDQLAGMEPFLEYVEQQEPGTLSEKAKTWLTERSRD